MRALLHPFNLLLGVIVIVAASTGDGATATVMSSMVTLSVLLRFVQELRSTISAENVKKQLITTVNVIRRNSGSPLPDYSSPDKQARYWKEHTSKALLEDIVPGDIISLSTGDIIPADVRLLESNNFLVNQSALTGESIPVEKTGEPIPVKKSVQFTTPEVGLDLQIIVEKGNEHGVQPSSSQTHPMDIALQCPNLCFMGTSVQSGSAIAVVVHTGDDTYMADNVGTLVQGRTTTSFDKGIRRISFLMIGFMAAMIPIVIVVNGLTTSWSEAVLFGIAVSVGLTPEMLPMIVNTNLARYYYS